MVKSLNQDFEKDGHHSPIRDIKIKQSVLYSHIIGDNEQIILKELKPAIIVNSTKLDRS